MRILFLVFAFVLGALAPAGVAQAAGHRPSLDKDCSDFGNQAQAQAYLLPGDPHRLDADGDGRACDSLPCPCSSSRTRTPLGISSSSSGVRKQAQRKQNRVIRNRAMVIRVIDGDTVDVRIKRRVKRVRIVGIDTPEVYGWQVMCAGPEASAYLRRLLPYGTWVRLASDPTQASVDKYSRLLRYVNRISDGRDVGAAQVSAGLARSYVYRGVPYQRVSGYAALEAQARASGLGAWACAMPFSG